MLRLAGTSRGSVDFEIDPPRLTPRASKTDLVPGLTASGNTEVATGPPVAWRT